MQTLLQTLAVRTSLLPASRAGAALVKGTGIDTRGFDEALIILHQGTITGAGTNDVKVQESDDDVDDNYADIVNVGGDAAQDAVFTQKVAASDETVFVGLIQLSQRKRWIRIVATDAVAAVVSGALVILGKPVTQPVTQTNAAGFTLYDNNG